VSIAYDPGVRERPTLFPDPDDVFAGLDRGAAERLAARLGTPVYLLSEAALRERARAVRDAALGCDARAEVAWSVKTLPLAGVLRTLREEGFGTEVVSDLEYAMVRRLGVHPAEVVLNGPVRSDAVLSEALGDGAAVNLDHRGEIERVGRLAAEAGATFRVGLRVEFDPARRFGFRAARGEVREALDVLARTPGVELGGLHTHGGDGCARLRSSRRWRSGWRSWRAGSTSRSRGSTWAAGFSTRWCVGKSRSGEARGPTWTRGARPCSARFAGWRHGSSSSRAGACPRRRLRC
jgi:hypothetical protein